MSACRWIFSGVLHMIVALFLFDRDLHITRGLASPRVAVVMPHDS